MQAAATTRAGKSHTQVGKGWTGSLRKPSTKVETGEEGTAGERGRGAAPRDEGAACTREQVALLFTISTAGLSHDFARYSQLCKTSTIMVVTTRVAVGVKGENSPEAPLTELSSYNLTIIMII